MEHKFAKIGRLIQESFGEFPVGLMAHPFIIVYCTKEAGKTFRMFELCWTKEAGWAESEIELAQFDFTKPRSLVIKAYGTGGGHFQSLLESNYNYKEGMEGYSREIFNCFCEAIKDGDAFSGGSAAIGWHLSKRNS